MSQRVLQFERVGFDVGIGVRQRIFSLAETLADDEGGVSTIAGMAALTIGVLAAAGIVVGVMMDHAQSVPGPGGSGGPAVVGVP